MEHRCKEDSEPYGLRAPPIPVTFSGREYAGWSPPASVAACATLCFTGSGTAPAMSQPVRRSRGTPYVGALVRQRLDTSSRDRSASARG
eukprot:8216584-Pyramimonas_sp.AAC.1